MKIYRIADIQQGLDPQQEFPLIEAPQDIPYQPLTSNMLSGLQVLDNVDNTGSIASSLNDYKIMDGIRSVPMADFPGINGRSYSVENNNRIKELARQIKDSGTISPLIVVIEKDDKYILEGSHRIDALYLLGVAHFPALVVIDLEDGV